MDFNVNTDKRYTETINVAVTPANMDTLWNIFKQMDINLPIHSLTERVKFDGVIMYWLKSISEKQPKPTEKR